MPGHIRAHCARAKTHWPRGVARSSRSRRCRLSWSHPDCADTGFMDDLDHFSVTAIVPTNVRIERICKPKTGKVDVIRRDTLTVLVLANIGLALRAYAEIVNDDMAVRPQYAVALGDNFEPVRRIGAVEAEAIDHEIIDFIPRRQAFGGAAPSRHSAGRRLDATPQARPNAASLKAIFLRQKGRQPTTG